MVEDETGLSTKELSKQIFLQTSTPHVEPDVMKRKLYGDLPDVVVESQFRWH